MPFYIVSRIDLTHRCGHPGRIWGTCIEQEREEAQACPACRCWMPPIDYYHLETVVGRLHAANPGRVGEFRVSKDAASVAWFPPERPDPAKGYLVYSKVVDGTFVDLVPGIPGPGDKPYHLVVPAQMYWGFPDPPKPPRRLRVGDRVTYPRTARQGEAAPLVRDGVVVEATEVQWTDRTWHYRVKVHFPSKDRSYPRSDGGDPVVFPCHVEGAESHFIPAQETA